MTDNEWVLVPRTVTAEMEAVYANDTGAYPDAQSLHDAMLAAAPSPPSADEGLVERARLILAAQYRHDGDKAKAIRIGHKSLTDADHRAIAAVADAMVMLPTQAQLDELQRQLDEAMELAEEAVRQRDAALAQQPAAKQDGVRELVSAATALCDSLDSGEDARRNYLRTRDALLSVGLASKSAAPAPVDGRNPLQAYADSYRQMARMGDGKVHCLSVAADIENNMIKHAAPAPVVRDAVAWLIDWPDEPELGHYLGEDRNENARSRPLYLHPSPADTAPPARHGDALTAQERHVIEALLDLAYKAWCLADDSEDMGDSHNVEAADFDALSNALDVLQALPDDQPGYTMGEAAKARWALRRLIGTDAAIAVQAKGGA